MKTLRIITGADAHVQVPYDGQVHTPLTVAIASERWEVIRLLKEHFEQAKKRNAENR